MNHGARAEFLVPPPFFRLDCVAYYPSFCFSCVPRVAPEHGFYQGSRNSVAVPEL